MRSMLFIPALNPDRALAGWRFRPDAMILDLEDTVPPARKQDARNNVRAVLDQASRPYFVRINGVKTPWAEEDLRAALHDHLAGVVVPKTEGSDEIRFIDNILTEYEVKNPRDEPIAILPIIETVAGLDATRSVARSSGRIIGLTFGEGDFTRDLGLDWADSPTVTAAQVHLVIESRLAGIGAPHHGVYPRLGDPDGLRRHSEAARNLGFGAKHCIHPSQLEIVHEVFSPSASARQHARAIVEAFDEAVKHGVASIVVDGQFVDYPVYQRALQVLQKGVSDDGTAT